MHSFFNLDVDVVLQRDDDLRCGAACERLAYLFLVMGKSSLKLKVLEMLNESIAKMARQ